MRPDEHKKKKNANYKKKHGIPANKNCKKGEGKDNDDARDERKAQVAAKTTCKDELTGKTQENETKTFSRRKIQSNWMRYDDSDVSDDEVKSHSIQRRGADFSALVEGAGDSHSQFRFQDEKDWEDTDSQTSQYLLQINVQELSESLKSLPMHERLNLEELNIGEDTAIPTHGNSKRIPECEDTAMLETFPESQNNIKAIKKIKFLPCDRKIEKDIHCCDAPSGIASLNTESDNSFEDELDMLLSLDKKNKQPSHQTDHTAKHAIKSLLGNVEETSTDSTIKKQFTQQINHSLKKDVDTNSSKKQARTSDIIDSSQKPSSPKKEDNLEDWLDSVLAI
ncbi:cell death regulator Aven [Exaiptasia diaphana]|uniref:Cell death regulator Aven n=1 Tax=Exaiptasia diaphana TaxID=2652724 RepID=A0A913XKB0_EXADI|nr:cell death regulator Aven [Exaiptasia diaphana]KXJ25729.1 Cell death regulator Aven [Exaiptasia diaphana]